MSVDFERRAVLIDIAYEIGGVGLSKFVHLLAAVREGKWATAAAELKNSLLYQQVPKREQENMMILTLGEFPKGVTSARDLIKRHEGCIFKAQPDAKGMWAIGYGHDIPAPDFAMTCTQREADAWFETDFELAEMRAEANVGSEHW